MTEAQLQAMAARLDDPLWRLSNLYQIIAKGDDDQDDGLVVRFKPNRAQRRLLSAMHNRNIILKARQLGYTTLVCMLWLDTALFAKTPIRCGIVAQDREAAEAIFRGKILFAYDHLPEALRLAMPLAKRTATEIEFEHNGSSIRVATSMRSGTIHRLHISEFGKICAKYPDKAKEVVTGSIPAVPKSGICIIESTAEGQDGAFYSMTQRAQALAEQGTELTEKDWKFHFSPWWDAPEYSLPEAQVVFTDADRSYFSMVEGKIHRRLSHGQRAWYVTTRRADFADEAPLMWQEYPSYPEEAFQVSTEGCYFAAQLAEARRQGRVLQQIPFAKGVPVHTFWDIGRGDMTAIWFMQKVGPEYRFIHYYENSGEELDHYTTYLLGRGWTYGTHWLPHEASHKRIGKSADTNQSIREMLEELLPGARFEVVPRVTSLISGIQATRAAMSQAYYCETGAGAGIKRVANHRKRWNKALGCWSEEEQRDDNCHGSDAHRQWGQLVAAGETFGGGAYSQSKSEGSKPFRRRGSPMAV